MLLSLVLMALYRSADMLRASNKNLFGYLERSTDNMRGSKVLYLDILQSDGNISIERKERDFHRIIIYNTQNSLYGIYNAKVIWLVYKENKTLLRIEGGDYKFPLTQDDNVEIDEITKNIELFTTYRSRKEDRMLVVIKATGMDAQSFMLQHISKPRPKLKLVNPSELSGDKRSKKYKAFVPAKI
jgi:hypothetical protein